MMMMMIACCVLPENQHFPAQAEQKYIHFTIPYIHIITKNINANDEQKRI